MNGINTRGNHEKNKSQYGRCKYKQISATRVAKFLYLLKLNGLHTANILVSAGAVPQVL